MRSPAANSKDSRWRRWFGPLLPASNSVLANEARRCHRRWRRSAGIAFLLLLLWGQSGFSIFLEISPHPRDQWFPTFVDQTIFGYLAYYLQFTLFHLALYLLPPIYLLSLWWARRRSGHWEQMIQTPATRAELFWSFVLPRTILIFLFIYGFYMTMWPWADWWLLRFPGAFETPKVYWTRFHVLVTTLYFVTALLFNMTSAVWAGLRTRSQPMAWILYLAVTLVFDFAAYCLLFLLGVPSVSNFHESFFEWPMVLYTLLAIHSLPLFAAIFYPVKWVLLGLMVFDITRRIPGRQWTAPTDDAT